MKLIRVISHLLCGLRISPTSSVLHTTQTFHSGVKITFQLMASSKWLNMVLFVHWMLSFVQKDHAFAHSSKRLVYGIQMSIQTLQQISARIVFIISCRLCQCLGHHRIGSLVLADWICAKKIARGKTHLTSTCIHGMRAPTTASLIWLDSFKSIWKNRQIKRFFFLFSRRTQRHSHVNEWLA